MKSRLFVERPTVYEVCINRVDAHLYTTERERRLIDYASRVAGIAIGRSRFEAAPQQAFEEIRKSEGQLQQITDAIPQTDSCPGAGWECCLCESDSA